MKYGLSERTLSTLNAILKRYPSIKEAVLYGSRAEGNYRNGSDIDLSLKTNEGFTHRNLLRLMEDFDDSDMPYLVDVSIYGELSNPDLKAHIDRLGVILYTGE